MILITGVKLPLPSMGTEFSNQCCQSPSGLTFPFTAESYHRVLPFWDAICQAVSFDLFPASTFVPSFMSFFCAPSNLSNLRSPCRFSNMFWKLVDTMKCPSNISYYRTLGNITVIWREPVRRPRLGRRWPQMLFSSQQVIFQSSGWGRSLNHWWLCIFSVVKGNQYGS